MPYPPKFLHSLFYRKKLERWCFLLLEWGISFKKLVKSFFICLFWWTFFFEFWRKLDSNQKSPRFKKSLPKKTQIWFDDFFVENIPHLNMKKMITDTRWFIQRLFATLLKSHNLYRDFGLISDFKYNILIKFWAQ